MLDHRWDITPREAIALQRELASRVIVQPLEHAVRTIAGVFSQPVKRIISSACKSRTICCNRAISGPSPTSRYLNAGKRSRKEATQAIILSLPLFGCI